MSTEPPCDLPFAHVPSECFNDDVSAHTAKGQSRAAVKVYAVRADYNQLLDIARQTHKENVADIFSCKVAGRVFVLPTFAEKSSTDRDELKGASTATK